MSLILTNGDTNSQLAINSGYMLEPLCRDSFDEYPQSMFWSKTKNKRYVYPCILQFFYIKVGYKGVYISCVIMKSEMTSSFPVRLTIKTCSSYCFSLS